MVLVRCINSYVPIRNYSYTSKFIINENWEQTSFECETNLDCWLHTQSHANLKSVCLQWGTMDENILEKLFVWENQNIFISWNGLQVPNAVVWLLFSHALVTELQGVVLLIFHMYTRPLKSLWINDFMPRIALSGDCIYKTFQSLPANFPCWVQQNTSPIFEC